MAAAQAYDADRRHREGRRTTRRGRQGEERHPHPALGRPEQALQAPRPADRQPDPVEGDRTTTSRSPPAWSRRTTRNIGKRSAYGPTLPNIRFSRPIPPTRRTRRRPPRRATRARTTSPRSTPPELLAVLQGAARLPSPHITAEKYKQLLYWNAWSQFVGGDTRYPDANEFWADWNPATKTIDYRSWIHHTILGSSNWTVIEDVMGLRPRSDGKVELWPVDIGWDHFTVNGINYRGSDLSIVWDKPGDGTTHYAGVPEGYSIFIDGKRKVTLASLAHAVWDPATGNGRRRHTSCTARRPGHEGPGRGRTLRATGSRTCSRRPASTSRSTTRRTWSSPPPPRTRRRRVAPSTASRSTSRTGAARAPATPRTDWTSRPGLRTARRRRAAVLLRNDRKDGLQRTRPVHGAVPRRHRPGRTSRQAKDPAYPRANLNRGALPVRRHPEAPHPHHPPARPRHRTEGGPGVLDRLGAALRLRTAPRTCWPCRTPPSTGPRRPGSPPSSRTTACPSGDTDHHLEHRRRPRRGRSSPTPRAPATVASFTEAGTYNLRLTATDGAKRPPKVTVTVGATRRAGERRTVRHAHRLLHLTLGEGHRGQRRHRPAPLQRRRQPRWGTWPQQGTQWVQLEWPAPVRVDKTDMYFFDDAGGVRVPASWKIQYWDGDSFEDVTGAAPTPPPPTPTTGVLRPRHHHQAPRPTGGPAGLTRPAGVEGVRRAARRRTPRARPDPRRETPHTPGHVETLYSDGHRGNTPVTWQPVTPDQVETGGTSFTVAGLAEGVRTPVQATVYVRTTGAVTITSIAEDR